MKPCNFTNLCNPCLYLPKHVKRLLQLTDNFRRQQQLLSQRETKINNMAIIQISGCVLLLSGVVTARPSVLDVPQQSPEQPIVVGSLTLHYQDNSTLQIFYDSSSQDCMVNHLPRKKIAKVELHSSQFVLYTKKNWTGRSATVSAVGNKKFSAEEIPGITRVKSVKQQGCWKTKQS